MTVLHSGTTKKYSDNWDSVFQGGKTLGKAAGARKKATKKSSPKRKAAASKKAAKRGKN